MSVLCPVSDPLPSSPRGRNITLSECGDSPGADQDRVLVAALRPSGRGKARGEYRVHSTEYWVQRTQYRVLGAAYTVQSTGCRLQSTLRSRHSHCTPYYQTDSDDLPTSVVASVIFAMEAQHHWSSSGPFCALKSHLTPALSAAVSRTAAPCSWSPSVFAESCGRGGRLSRLRRVFVRHCGRLTLIGAALGAAPPDTARLIVSVAARSPGPSG